MTIVFKELDYEWLKDMLDEDGDTRQDMIEIPFLLYLLHKTGLRINIWGKSTNPF